MISPELWVSDPAVPGGVSKMNEEYQDEKWKASGRLVAWDPVTQKARWEARRELPVNGGIISTGGNLVFQGTAMGQIEAYKADTGEKVWSANIGAAVQAAPATVELDGEQYLIVVAGNGASGGAGIALTRYTACESCRKPATLLAFKLGGTAQMPKWDPLPPYPMPPMPRFPAELAAKGLELAEGTGCEFCHGVDWVSAHGTPADLRRTGAERHGQFKAIVHDGILKDLGMPGFDQLSDEDLKALQAHLINTAWDAYDDQERNHGQGKPQ
jgi:quinohemoprotein ethanol dehydrogenase